jgi:dethiobiotin synthase
MITYIVGTDTDAGKTYYGQELIKQGHPLIKPIETGRLAFEDIEKSDSYTYARLQGLSIDSVNLYFFSEPVSPHLASEIDHRPIDCKALINFITSKSPVHVELAGGLMVPITRHFTQLDLIKATGGQVDLVVGNKLGCINHALLTLKILHDADIPVSNIFINDFGKKPSLMQEDNKKTIFEYFEKLT